MSKTPEEVAADLRQAEAAKRRKHRADAVAKLDAATRAQLPKYKCHKIVAAAKIERIEFGYDEQRDRSVHLLIPEDKSLKPIAVEQAFMSKHSPAAPGYFVVYESASGGEPYESWSPVAEFEAGYTLETHGPDVDFKALEEGLIYREPIDNGDRHQAG